MKGIVGIKLGMTHIWDAEGRQVPVTVVEVGPCTVVGTRTQARNGYSALQLGYGVRRIKNVTKPVRGQIKAAGFTENAPALIREIRLGTDPAEAVGDVLHADMFAVGEFVDVTGVSKGKGYQGVVRRHHFAGGRASHGGGWHRRTGSIGCKEKPGKVYKGRKMPGHMGNDQRTVQNLRVAQVRKDDNLLLIRGAIPGPAGRPVVIMQAIKKHEVAK